jgi:hypothetical protein
MVKPIKKMPEGGLSREEANPPDVKPRVLVQDMEF